MSDRPCGNKTAASVLPVLGHVLSRCGIIDRVMAAAVVCLGVTLAALANPAGPDLFGTWDATATIANPTYMTFNSGGAPYITMNSGITVTLDSGSALSNTTLSRCFVGDGTFVNNGTMVGYHQTGADVSEWRFTFGTTTLVFTNAGLLDVSTDPAGYNLTFNIYGASDTLVNTGTIRKSGGSGRLAIAAAGGTFVNSGGTIRVVSGVFSNAIAKGSYAGEQTVDVVNGSTYVAQQASSMTYGGRLNGTNEGVVIWWCTLGTGGPYLDIAPAGFILDVDNGDWTDYTKGAVWLKGNRTYATATSGVVTNQGKFYLNTTGRYYNLSLHNSGWFIWDFDGLMYQGTAYTNELRNLAGGIMDILKGSSPGGAGSGNKMSLVLDAGSTTRGKAGTGNTASWNLHLNEINIKNGATVEVHSGELEFNPKNSATNMFFNGVNTAMSTLNFNVTVSNSATLDIRNISPGGIDTLGAGSTLRMAGNAQIVSNATDALQSKLATVNGKLLLAEGFILTPGGGTLTVSSSGTIGGTGTVNGALSCAGTNLVSISGPTNDVLAVNGTVDLTGATLTLSVGGEPTQDEYAIIVNDGMDAVTGTFSGLPEGSQVSVGDGEYTITYVGGTGNDVMLRLAGGAGTVVLFR